MYHDLRYIPLKGVGTEEDNGTVMGQNGTISQEPHRIHTRIPIISKPLGEYNPG